MTRPLALLLVAISVLVAPAAGQDGLDRVLPERTLAALVADDLGALADAWRRTPLGGLWLDEAFADARNELVRRLERSGEDLAAEWGVDPVEVLGAAGRAFALAVVELAEEDKLLDEPGGPSPMVLALVLAAGEDEDHFVDGVDALAEALADASGLVLNVDELAGADVGVLVDPDDPDSELTYGFVEGHLVATLGLGGRPGDEAYVDLADGLVGAGAGALADVPAYADSVAADPSGIRLWASGDWLLRFALLGAASSGDELPEPVRRLLGGAGALGARLDAAGGWSRQDLVMSVTGDGGPLLDVLAAATASGRPELARWMPADVQQAMLADLDVDALFEAVLGAMFAADPEAGREAVASMAAMEEGLGFHPRHDILDNLDGQLGFYVREPPPGTPSAMGIEGALLLGLTDGDAMRTVLDGLVRNQGLHAVRERREFEGFEVWRVPFFVDLHYAVLSDLLVVAVDPASLEDVLRRRGSGDLPSLASSPAWRDVHGELSGPATFLSYSRAADQTRTVLEALALLQDAAAAEAQDAEGDEGPWSALRDGLLAIELPDPSIVDEHLEGGAITRMLTGEDGVVVEAVGP